ncbi:MAG TPA: ParA family protein [Stenomitos sp.]
MAENRLIAVTGDKGGVGKSTIVSLLAEWLLYEKQFVKVVDADPNQTIKTWIDKCAGFGRQISYDKASITLVDTSGTSGSSLTQYIRKADLVLVPFKPHVADLEVVLGWFLSLKETIQERVLFIPNMVSKTKEQRAGIEELEKVVKEEGRGQLLCGISERKAVYPSLLNGSATNFFDGKLDENTRSETEKLFTQIIEALKG